MKSIVFLTQYFPPEMGAPQSRLYEAAIGLQRLGWDVAVVTAMPNYPTGRVFPSYRRRMFMEETIDGIRVYRYALYASNSRSALPRIISMLSFSFTSFFSLFKLLRLKPEYIFTESPPLTLAVTGITLAKFIGAKHLMNVSDIWPLSALELGAVSPGILYNSLKKLEQALYKKSFACTGQSQEIADYLSASNCKRVHLFRNGVDSNRFKLATPQPTGKLKIVYAGLLGVAQGVLQLVRHIDFNALGVEFHIYGNGAELEDIAQYITDVPVNGVFLHNAVSRQDVAELLSEFDITIIPLIKPIYGAVPSKIYEAMAAGLPIIFTGGGEGAKLVQTHNVGWNCAPGDYEKIKQTIKLIVSMPADEMLQLRSNCRHAAENYFDRSIQVDKLHQFLIQP